MLHCSETDENIVQRSLSPAKLYGRFRCFAIPLEHDRNQGAEVSSHIVPS